MALALAFGEFAQMLTRIDGLRITDVEPLLQLRQQGSQIGLRGLLMGGVIVSTLGAVMDVTMGITSAMAEVRAADPDMSAKALFRSGMNVGRDMVGTMTNTLIAFGEFAQMLTRIDGLRITDVEPLLQLRQQGSQIGLRGLLMGGVIVSTLGAVMDVTMGITSAMAEVRAADPDMSAKALFRSGMNVGRDMVGTMTNTLILAFLGSSFTLILYFYTIGLSFHQLLSSAYLSVEVISSVACSVGVILTIPITALLTAVVMSKQQKKTSLG